MECKPPFIPLNKAPKIQAEGLATVYLNSSKIKPIFVSPPVLLRLLEKFCLKQKLTCK